MKKILFLGLCLAVALTSCVKKKDVVTGDAHIRFVNAIPNSYPQDVYINADLVSRGKLLYGLQSPYFTYTAGVNKIGIANSATTTTNLSFSYGSAIGDYATVYFFRDFSGTLVAGGIKDDMTPPPSGKARVRFVNLQNYIQTSFTMATTGGTSLFTSLVFATASPYVDVDPGTKFTATAITVTDPVTIDFNPQAGKIYTVWINGSSDKELLAYPLIQN